MIHFIDECFLIILILSNLYPHIVHLTSAWILCLLMMRDWSIITRCIRVTFGLTRWVLMLFRFMINYGRQAMYRRVIWGCNVHSIVLKHKPMSLGGLRGCRVREGQRDVVGIHNAGCQPPFSSSTAHTPLCPRLCIH